LRRGPGAPEYIACRITQPDRLAHLDLIHGEIRLTARDENYFLEHICEVVRIDVLYTRAEHPIRPLSPHHLGDLVLGLSPADQAPWLGDRDLERGTLRAVVWGDAGVVRFASAYLGDLGSHFAVPRRPLLALAELEADLAARWRAGVQVATVNGTMHFAPQVSTSDERVAFSRLPVLSVTARSEGYQHEGPTAVPLLVGDQTRFLMFQTHRLKWSGEQAERRGRIIDRIVEDGARAGEIAK
jgi:hypothetical protein